MTVRKSGFQRELSFAFEINLYWRILNENKRAARRAGRLRMYAYAAVARLTEPSASAGNVLS
jgi:hypothetical protein